MQRTANTVDAPIRDLTSAPDLRSRDELWLALICSCASLAALLVCWRRSDILLYGDAVAHIGIARRVVDSLTPGLRQLGTVWLPLPHLLLIPLVAPLAWWRSGVPASLPSMAAYVLASVGVFRLVQSALASAGVSPASTRAAAWLAALAFAANPNLLYLQATAMTEALYLALFVWAIVYFAEFAAAANRDAGPSRAPLLRSGFLLAAAEMTRYDGWFAAVCVGVAVVAGLARPAKSPASRRRVLFLAMVAAPPLFWLAYNASVYGNPLEFATGPYSARAIEQRNMAKGDPPHPGAGNLAAAAQQYVRAVELNLGEKRWGPTVFWAAVAGALWGAARAIRRRRSASLGWLMLWAPLPFYALSLGWGSVPIFLPMWWPYAYYNARYGLQLLPAAAISAAVLAALVAELAARQRTRRMVFAPAAVFIAAAYLSCFIQNPARTKEPLPGEPYRGPIVRREAVVNASTRIPFEQKLATALATLPASSSGDQSPPGGGSRLLMFTGDHVGALQRAGIPLRRVVNETNWRMWQLALLAPADAADYVVAMEGDAVAAAVRRHPDRLEVVAMVDSPGQPHTVVYHSRR